jgi:hypothetical protein
MTSRIESLAVSIALAVGSVLARQASGQAPQSPAAAEVAAASTRILEDGEFRVRCDAQGVVGLSNANDPFNAQVLSRGGRLGVFARYRLGAGEWQTLPAAAIDGYGEKQVTYTSGGTPVKVTQALKIDAGVLDWTIEVGNTGPAPAEVGDLAIVFPWNRPAGEDKKTVFEQGFTKHQFIEGAGSFLCFVRASGVGPYLIVTTKPGTNLEYTGVVGTGRAPPGPPNPAARIGRFGTFAAFIHSRLTAESQPRGTWRQPNTALKLAAAGSDGSKVAYGFRMHWAKTYDDMRETLYRDGLFDMRMVPGMTIPSDLTAKFALHTQARIEGIDPEFPAETTVSSLGEPQPGYHLFEAKFGRLGENRLAIRHDGGRRTYLEFFSTEPLETLIKKRSAFIAFHQQWRDPTKWYDGLFSVYDMQHKILRSPEDTDGFDGRMGYVLTCDDTCLGKAPYVAEKNVHYPAPKEIEAVEYYLQHFVWGGLQRTDKEVPYPYAIYGIPNWKIQRDPVAKRAFEVNDNRRPDLAEKIRVFRSYDYPHVTMLYFHMYEIAKKYPTMLKYLDAGGYLERAYQTARAYFTYPYELLPNYYETYKWGCYNELVILKLIDALEQEGLKDRADWLRGEWEKKVKYFVYDDDYPFRSEYAFDRTAYESSYALAKYGATHQMQPDEKLWHDIKLDKWYSHPTVKEADSRAFMDRQLRANLAVRGVLECAFYLLGADFTASSDRGAMSYMAPMGGSGILDYGVNFADSPYDWLQLGYASYLSAWALMNTGTPQTNYGYWYPGKENDGASGWTFMTAKFGRGWDNHDDARGPWHYDGEIDLGYGAELRMAATVVTRDPIFDWVVYGGTMNRTGNALSVVPRDGLRQRLFAVIGDPRNPKTSLKRLKLELDRDGFRAGQPIELTANCERIAFNVENRTGGEHVTGLWLSPPAGMTYSVLQNQKQVELVKTGNWDYPFRADLRIGGGDSRIEIVDVSGKATNHNR